MPWDELYLSGRARCASGRCSASVAVHGLRRGCCISPMHETRRGEQGVSEGVVSQKSDTGSKGYPFLGSAWGTKEVVDLFTRREFVDG